jgi:DNA invertase Pin-like site-specific DNA recombinase
MKNTAWAYLTVSSGEQADSIPNQRSWAEKCAAQHGWTITREISGPGSGKDGPRVKYEEMMAALRRLSAAQRPEWVLMIRLDRVGRGANIGQMQTALYELHELGVRVWTREGGEERQDDIMAQLITAVKLTAGAQENANKRDKADQYYERMREAQQANPRIRTSSKPPYGVRCVTPVIGQPGHFEPKEPEAQAIRRMFELRSQRVGPAEIARRVQAEFGPPAPRNGKSSAKRWHADYISKMLTSKVYVHAGVVSQQMFDLANVPLSRAGGRRDKVYVYPLARAIRCTCGSRIHGQAGGTKKYGYTLYYICPNRSKAHDQTLYWRVDHLEQQFADFLQQFATVPALRAIVAERNGDDVKRRGELGAELDSIHRELTTVRRRKERLMSDLEDEDDDAVRRELRKRLADYAKHEAEFERQQKSTHNALTLLDAQAGNAEERERTMLLADELWAQSTPETRKEIAAAVAAAMHGPLIVDENGVLESELLGQLAIAKRLARRKSA